MPKKPKTEPTPPPIAEEALPVPKAEGAGPGGLEYQGQHRVVPVGELRPNTWNYNTQGERTFGKLVEAIRRLGFTKPVIARSHPGATPLEIVDGEHRWRAAKMLGMKAIPVVDLGVVEDARAKQLTVVLNELSGQPDDARLAELLRDVQQEAQLDAAALEAYLPFSSGEIDAYLTMVNFSFDKLPTGDVRPQDQRLGETVLAGDSKPRRFDSKKRLQVVFHGSDARKVEELAAKLGFSSIEDAIMETLTAAAETKALDLDELAALTEGATS